MTFYVVFPLQHFHHKHEGHNTANTALDNPEPRLNSLFLEVVRWSPGNCHVCISKGIKYWALPVGQLTRDKGEIGGGQWMLAFVSVSTLLPAFGNLRRKKVSDNNCGLSVGQPFQIARKTVYFQAQLDVFVGKDVSQAWQLEFRPRTHIMEGRATPESYPLTSTRGSWHVLVSINKQASSSV